MTDTSTEAVARLAVTLEEHGGWEYEAQIQWATDAAAKLRALAAERDALKAEVERLNMALKEAEEEMASGCDATAYRVICAALQENTDD